MAIKSSDDLDWPKKLDTLVANYNKVPNATTEYDSSTLARRPIESRIVVRMLVSGRACSTKTVSESSTHARSSMEDSR